MVFFTNRLDLSQKIKYPKKNQNSFGKKIFYFVILNRQIQLMLINNGDGLIEFIITEFGFIQTQYFCTQYCGKKIKRYFSTNICFHRVNWKYLFFSMDTRICIENNNILKCHYNILKKKLPFYHNIFLLQYVLCVKMSRVNNALM